MRIASRARTALLSTGLALAAATVPLAAHAPALSRAGEMHLSAAHAVGGPDIRVAGIGTYRFSAVVGGKAVRWDPCRPIHWAANIQNAPTGGLTVLKQAVSEVSALTGTTWVYDGTSTATPATSYLPTRA